MATNYDEMYGHLILFSPMPAMQWRNKDVFHRQIKNSEKLKEMFILDHKDVFGGVIK